MKIELNPLFSSVSDPEDVYLRDAEAFLCGDLMQCTVQNRREALLGDVDPLYLSHEKVGAKKNMCRNMVTVKMTGDSDENSATDLWPDDSTDAEIKNASDCLRA